MAKKEKVSFLYYYEYVEQFKLLEKEEIITIIEDIIHFEKEGMIPTYKDRTLQSIWNMIFKNLSEDNRRYIEKCKIAQKNGSLGGRPTENQNKPIGYTENQEKPKGYKNSKNKKNKPKKPDIDTHIDKDIILCVEEKENSKNNTKFCHLERNSKIEACKDCLKNKICPLQTDPSFLLEKNKSFEEWLAERQVLNQQFLDSKSSSEELDDIDDILEDYDYLNEEDNG